MWAVKSGKHYKREQDEALEIFNMWCLSCHSPPLLKRRTYYKKNYRSECVYIATNILLMQMCYYYGEPCFMFHFGVWKFSFATLAERLGLGNVWCLCFSTYKYFLGILNSGTVENHFFISFHDCFSFVLVTKFSSVFLSWYDLILRLQKGSKVLFCWQTWNVTVLKQFFAFEFFPIAVSYSTEFSFEYLPILKDHPVSKQLCFELM